MARAREAGPRRAIRRERSRCRGEPLAGPRARDRSGRRQRERIHQTATQAARLAPSMIKVMDQGMTGIIESPGLGAIDVYTAITINEPTARQVSLAETASQQSEALRDVRRRDSAIAQHEPGPPRLADREPRQFLDRNTCLGRTLRHRAGRGMVGQGQRRHVKARG